MDQDLLKDLENLDRQLAECPTGKLYLRRGMLYWRMQKHAAAMADYGRAVALDGENSEAAAALAMARSVMDFFNKDLYNP